MALLTYVPSQVSVSLAGLFEIDGFVDGTFVEINKNITPYQHQSAMDGETARTFVYDTNYTVTITLAQTSESNNILNSIHAIDLAAQIGKLPILIRDKNGSTQFFSPTAWIENYPTIGFSNSMETRVWTLRCTQCVLSAGGAGDASIVDRILGNLPGVANIIGGL